MLKQKYFLTDIFILSTEKQPIKLSWRKIEWLLVFGDTSESVDEVISPRFFIVYILGLKNVFSCYNFKL